MKDTKEEVKQKTDKLIEVDLAKLNREGWRYYNPAILVFGKYVYRLSNWQELLKIFYYLAFKEPGGAEFFSMLNNQYTVIVGNKLISKPVTYNGNILTVMGKKVFTNKLASAYNGVKFYKNNFVSCHNNSVFRMINFDLVESSAIDNLTIIGYVINSLKLQSVKIYIASSDYDKEEIESAKTEIIKKLTDRSTKNRKVEKNTKYVIAHINGEILSPAEKFYKHIEREFDKKILLGDIIISEDEEGYLKEYMVSCLSFLDSNGSISCDVLIYPKVFAFGLVRYAMKYYSQKTFWPYFKKEYGVEVKVQNQSVIHDEFKDIMLKYHKRYDGNNKMKIDNISMHSFVTDRCADQFFDFLFDFWRIALKRNFENIYDQKGKAYFDNLLEKIGENYNSPINNVMKHTSMALKCNKKSCVLRIKRILKLIDDCFWNQMTELPQTGNRINILLQKWMQNKNCKFAKEYKVVNRKVGIRGEKLLSAPLLCVNFYRNEFSIKLPQEILKHCTDFEHPYWEIKAEGLLAISIEPTLYNGSIGYYTQECEISLPQEYLFCKITATLLSAERRYANYHFKETELRFFNDKGVLIDHTKGYISEGLNVAYGKTVECFPQIMDKASSLAVDGGEFWVKQYQLEDGDILLLSDGHAIPVGKRIAEGLIGSQPIKDVFVTDGDEQLSVYNTLPKILFKSKREQLGGTALFINDTLYQVSKLSYHEFKLDDSFEDIYAYLIDLKAYIQDDGIYSIRVDIPQSQAKYHYKFVYLKDLYFRFIDAPYIFKDTATIAFDKKANIKIDKEWDISPNENSLQFNFDAESDDYCKDVEDRFLTLNYIAGSEEITLSFTIPALFWKYKKEEQWKHKQPADMSIKKIPSHLYVYGPFDFKNKNTHLNIDDIETGFDETDIYAEKVKDENYYSFNLSNIKSWLDYSLPLRPVSLTLNGNKIAFVNIVCRSSINKVNLSGDYKHNTIYGNFDISGSGEFTVKIKHNGEIIGQDIPIENGKFELETENLGGTYEITVYEIIEDESGFDDSDSIKIGEYSLELVDLTSLQGNAIWLQSFSDCKKEYKPLQFSQGYVIRNLKYVGQYKDVSDWEVYGLWKFNFQEPEEMAGCIFYMGTLSHIEDNQLVDDFNVLVIFYDSCNLDKHIILREYEGEYLELLYDILHHKLLYDESGLKKWQKKGRLLVLADSRYDCVAEILNKDILKRRGLL